MNQLAFFFLFVPTFLLSQTGVGQDCIKAKDSLVKEFSQASNAFLYGAVEEKMVTIIWKKDSCAVMSILADSKIADETRFIAAEIFLENTKSIPAEIDKTMLAELYAQSLLKEFSSVGLNYWGMNSTKDVWHTGRHLLRLGSDAIPAFTPLLNSNKFVSYCCGTKGAEMANAKWDYRVKDVAAFYILKIRGESFEWSTDPASRDLLIKQLKKDLRKGNNL